MQVSFINTCFVKQAVRKQYRNKFYAVSGRNVSVSALAQFPLKDCNGNDLWCIPH
jgi:hypothetical protein